MKIASNRHHLPAGSQAARAARVWVRQSLAAIGREDLLESAEMCVSELVTNAVLHAQPPYDVRIAGTKERPIIGVHDGSVLAPKLTVTRDPSDEDPLNTFGRGLSIVASYSSECGSSVDWDGAGKTVWFSPSSDPKPVEHPEVFDIGDLLAEPQRAAWQDVKLLNLPMGRFLLLSQRFEEFNRELQVVVHNTLDADEMLVEFIRVVAVAREHLRAATNNEIMWEAMARGPGQGDFTLGVDPALADVAERVLELMRVLIPNMHRYTTMATPLCTSDLELQRWYFEQFIQQIRGGAPQPWTGECDEPGDELASAG